MRPLELRLRNFRSFHGEDHSFDFRDRRLIGVVGPIGSGKSTILDAIAFALYGRTPRIGRDTKSLIHQRADHAAVSLLFEVDGEIWESVRSLRRKGSSQHALYRLEEDSPLPPAEREKIAIEKISLKREVDSRIMELLGLDYDAFVRSVLLAQGRFAEFLNAPSGERNQVLKGVFGYERIDKIRDLAKGAADEAESEVSKLEIRLKDARTVEARLAEHRKELAGHDARFEQLEAVRPDFDELTERIKAVDKSREKAETRLKDLHSRTEELPDRTEAERTLEQAALARTKLATAKKKLEEASKRLDETREAVESEEFKERERSWEQASKQAVLLGHQEKNVEQAAEEVSNTIDAVAECERKVKQAGSAAEKAASDLKEAEAEKRQSASAWRRAEERLEDARHADMAGSLRQKLVAGDDCPVCEQPVHEVPARAESDTDTAKAVAREARSRHERANNHLLESKGTMSTARAEFEAAEQRLAESGKRLTEARIQGEEQQAGLDSLRDAIRCLLGEGDPATRLVEERADLDYFHQKAVQARQRQEARQNEFNQAVENEKGLQQQVSNLRARVGVLATLLDTGLEAPEDDPEAVRSALAVLRTEWKQNVSDLERTAEQERAKAGSDRERLAELKANYIVEGSIEAELAAVGAVRGQIQKEIKRNERRLAKTEGLAAEKEAWENIERLNRRLAKDLTDAKFIKFLLDEARSVLAGLGSEHFERLSSGRYRFTENGEFSVVDLNAAEWERGADSLSGGETFLASLGLALGLAEMVGRQGGRLDAFFLDEGFGTLDPEHLDLAMEGIESLVSDREQRLVVVVSHVPEVRERIEDLIELDNDSTTGDSRVITGGKR